MKKLFNISVCFMLISIALIGLTGTVIAAAPDIPEIDGPTEASVDTLADFTILNLNTTDDHDILLEVDWGDNFTTGWMGPFPAGEDEFVYVSHKFKEIGQHEIKVRAMDNETEEISDWSEPFLIDITGPGEQFAVTSITGGFDGIQAQIVNNLAPSKYVDYKIEVSGGFLGFHISKTYEGEVFIKSGGSAVISTGSLFGLGPIKVTVRAEAAGIEVAKEVEYGRILFIYVMI